MGKQENKARLRAWKGVGKEMEKEHPGQHLDYGWGAIMLRLLEGGRKQPSKTLEGGCEHGKA